MDNEKGEWLTKTLARAGLCSRRDAKAWIEAGRVAVNGRILTDPAMKVTDDDCIEVDGKKIRKAERTRLFLHHKPAGLVTTARDEKGRKTVFDSLPPGMPRVISVGRLDLNTEGLLLLTNDGELSRYMELPATGWRRTYRVRAYGPVTQKALDSLREGTIVDGVRYGPIEAALESSKGLNSWMTFVITEGKNREVRRVLESIGLKVNRLIRLSYGPFHLGEMNRGDVHEVPPRVMAEKIPDFFKGRL